MLTHPWDPGTQCHVCSSGRPAGALAEYAFCTRAGVGKALHKLDLWMCPVDRAPGAALPPRKDRPHELKACRCHEVSIAVSLRCRFSRVETATLLAPFCPALHRPEHEANPDDVPPSANYDRPVEPSAQARKRCTGDRSNSRALAIHGFDMEGELVSSKAVLAAQRELRRRRSKRGIRAGSNLQRGATRSRFDHAHQVEPPLPPTALRP